MNFGPEYTIIYPVTRKMGLPMRRSIALILLGLLSACGSGDGWYESKDWGGWAKSDGGRWYGDGSNEEEDSWWCEFMNTCEEEKSVACSQYGNCGDDADSNKDDGKDTSVACTMYGNCDDDGDGNADNDKDTSAACAVYGNCKDE